jgi:hypothetical protein
VVYVLDAPNAVKLPEIEMVCLQALQAPFEVAPCALRGALGVREGLGHEDDGVAPPLERRADPAL